MTFDSDLFDALDLSSGVNPVFYLKDIEKHPVW
jgi:hypothetical protein